MGLYNEGLEVGGARYIGDTIKVALLTAAYTPDVDHDGYAAIVAYELPATGTYVAGGVALGVKSVSVDDTNDLSHDLADDAEWSSLVTGSIRYAVIYDETADLLIRYIDFTTTRTLNGSAVAIRFANRRIRTRQAA